MSGLRILGLTGSIGTGKTNAADTFDAFGIPVFDADGAVHALYAPGGAAVAPVVAAFGAEVRDSQGGIDRRRLAARVLADPAARRRLEAIVHPLVRAAEYAFLERCARAGCWLAVLDIPLLFETGAERRCDRVAVTLCHPFLQEIRVLRRPGADPTYLARMRAAQLPGAEKRRRADYVIVTSAGRGATLARIGAIIRAMRRVPPRVWPHGWQRAARGLGGGIRGHA